MPRPPARQALGDFERIKPEHIDEWVEGQIDEVNYEPEHEFKGKHAKTAPAVRFKFILNGYEHPHYSRWMTFTFGEKSNLYKKYGVPLVDKAIPDMDFPTEAFHGLKVKVMYTENPSRDPKYPPFQSVDKIKPVDTKIPWNDDYKPKEAPSEPSSTVQQEASGTGEDQVPF